MTSIFSVNINQNLLSFKAKILAQKHSFLIFNKVFVEQKNSNRVQKS